MEKRLQAIFLSMATSVLSGVVIIVWIIFGSAVSKMNVLLPQIPAMLIIGAMVGSIAYSKGATRRVTIIGAACGWIGGSLLATNAQIIFEIKIREDLVSTILFYGLQIILGIFAGLVPLVLARLIGLRRTRTPTK